VLHLQSGPESNILQFWFCVLQNIATGYWPEPWKQGRKIKTINTRVLNIKRFVRLLTKAVQKNITVYFSQSDSCLKIGEDNASNFILIVKIFFKHLVPLTYSIKWLRFFNLGNCHRAKNWVKDRLFLRLSNLKTTSEDSPHDIEKSKPLD